MDSFLNHNATKLIDFLNRNKAIIHSMCNKTGRDQLFDGYQWFTVTYLTISEAIFGQFVKEA